MAMYAVESRRMGMRSTSIVEKVVEWVDSPDGRRRPSDHQARSEETGMPLWAVEVVYRQSSYGRVATVTAKVTVGAVHQPVLGDMDPVVFEGLQVEARMTKTGGFVESWSADGLADDTGTAVSAGKSGQPGQQAADRSGGRSAAA